ncbi:hypothetical protein ACFLUU_09460, partial [Chloroflexota bacterium]
MRNVLLWSFLSYLVVLTLMICSCNELSTGNDEKKAEIPTENDKLKGEKSADKNEQEVDFSIYIMNSDGTDIKKLISHGRAPGWSP